MSNIADIWAISEFGAWRTTPCVCSRLWSREGMGRSPLPVSAYQSTEAAQPTLMLPAALLELCWKLSWQSSLESCVGPYAVGLENKLFCGSDWLCVSFFSFLKKTWDWKVQISVHGIAWWNCQCDAVQQLMKYSPVIHVHVHIGISLTRIKLVTVSSFVPWKLDIGLAS